MQTRGLKRGESTVARVPKMVLDTSPNKKLKITAKTHTIGLTAEPPLPTLAELLADWDGSPPEPYDWGEPVGRELL
ncbi:MAG: hypothetical protein LBM98_02785 [Oscillospiraceae bacterium]|jgi:hypothetical protein|nr:hypothetical protein [Oscillospiraceae bacterium]